MTTTTDPIVEIRPSTEFFSITWTITTRCNYDCMYCPAEVHDTTSNFWTLEEFQKQWTSIFEKTSHLGLKYKISMSGGEATINKNFLPFLKWLKSEYGDHIGQLLLTSNGSASVNYYKKLYALIDNLSFGLHSEHVNEVEFFEKLIELNKFAKSLDKVLHVDLMDEEWNQARIPHYEKILEENKITYSRNQINYKYSTRTYPIFKGKLNLDIPHS